MQILEAAKIRFRQRCVDRGVDLSARVSVCPLSADQAIGPRADQAFAIRKGREVVVEARFGGEAGQAFTDSPGTFSGTLRDVLNLDLHAAADRVVLVAAMNAVLRHLGEASGTVHCRNEDPARCGPEMAAALNARFGRRRYALVGLQPAILAALVDRFSSESVRVVDLNPDNVGAAASGVEIRDGATQLPQLVEWCEVLLVTGSSIVNGTIDDIVARSTAARRSLVFFGNTISGVAALLNLDRLCPYAQ